MYPGNKFFNNQNHYFSYTLHEWSNLLVKFHHHNNLLNSRITCQGYIAVNLLIHILIALCNDVHPNPGPHRDYSNISICHINIRSIKGIDKLLHIKTDLADKYDIIALSETWLSDADKTEAFKLQGYQLPQRRDRSFGAHGYGGVMVWASDKIACKRRQDLEVIDIEAMWLEIRTDNKKFFLCVTYRSDSNTNLSFWDKLQENIDTVRANYNPKIMICGDLNADFNTRHGRLLTEFAETNNFTIHINEPTRITSTSSTVLDQFITNFPVFVKNVQILPPLSNCDHCLITAECLFRIKKPKPYTRVMWNFKMGDFELYRLRLSQCNWDECFQNDDIDIITDEVTNNILRIAKSVIPNRVVTVRPHDKSWYNNDLRRLNRRKLRYFKRAKRTKNPDDWLRFTEIRAQYQADLLNAKNNESTGKYSFLATHSKMNPKKWWSLLKAVYKNSEVADTIPPIEVNDDIITGDMEKAEAFNNFFLANSNINDSNVRVPDIDRILNNENDLTHIDISFDDVADQVKSLDSSKSYGPDGISPVLIKEGGDIICAVLQRLFTLSLQKLKFPASFKKANVIPIHKKDAKSTVSNYRPISLLSINSKIFEKIIFKNVYNFFKENFILSTYQSGFQAGKSTVTQLLEVYHEFCKAVDNNKEIRVIFLDISKAFDKVWHKGLMEKLKRCGISGDLLLWFEDYLKDRMQRVVINGQASLWGIIKAGVPQGAVLGPLLFLLFIDDLVQAVTHCSIRLFADDTCLFIEVDNRVDTAALINIDLESIQKWSQDWLVTFAPQKTKTLTISNKTDSNLNPPVRLNGNIIENVPSHTYLGLKFANNLRWNHHINDVSIKARKRLNLMIPLKFKLDRKSLEIIYKSFVLPAMEYASVVWGGTFDSDILKLEKIHVDGMRLVTGATARSNIANLYDETSFMSVSERRDYSMLVMLYKIKTGVAPDYLIDLLPRENHEYICYNLRNNDNIAIPYARLETFKRSFVPFATNLWNNLTLEKRNMPSLREFKSSLIDELNDPNILYYYGSRWSSIHHARLRIGCSKLKHDLCYNLHVIDNPSCSCGALVEDAHHYFFTCPNYNDLRLQLFNGIAAYCDVTLNTILYGNPQSLLIQFIYILRTQNVLHENQEMYIPLCQSLNTVVYGISQF